MPLLFRRGAWPPWARGRSVPLHEPPQGQQELCRVPPLASGTGRAAHPTGPTATDRPRLATTTGPGAQGLLHFLQTTLLRHCQTAPTTCDLAPGCTPAGGAPGPPHTPPSLPPSRPLHH